MADNRKVQDMMKKLNMDVKELDAQKVTIKTQDKELIILKPQVMLVDMMGRTVYQVTGSVVEEDDVQAVMKKTGKDRETVVRKLEELDIDLAKVIKELKPDEKKKK